MENHVFQQKQYLSVWTISILNPVLYHYATETWYNGESVLNIYIIHFFLWMLGGKVLCETENLDQMPHSIFLLEPRMRSTYKLGLLCLSLLWCRSMHSIYSFWKDFQTLSAISRHIWCFLMLIPLFPYFWSKTDFNFRETDPLTKRLYQP